MYTRRYLLTSPNYQLLYLWLTVAIQIVPNTPLMSSALHPLPFPGMMSLDPTFLWITTLGTIEKLLRRPHSINQSIALSIEREYAKNGYRKSRRRRRAPDRERA